MWSVLFVDHDVSRSGSTVSMEYLLRAFSRQGWEVHVLTPKRGSEAESLRATGVRILSSRGWGMNSLALDLHFSNTAPVFSPRGIKTLAKNTAKFILGLCVVCRAITRAKASLVYVNEHVMPQASLAARICGVPAVVHVRSRMLAGTWGFRRQIASWMTVRFNRLVFAISEEESRQLACRGVVPAHVVVVGEFVSVRDAEDARVSAALELAKIPRDCHVISMLGGILSLKGTLTFLSAAEEIAARREDVYFVLAGPHYGDGDKREHEHYRLCMEGLARLTRKGRATYLGNITNAPDLIAASEIIVSPSIETHFSRPIIEAWAAGKPVVAARTPHTEALIRDTIDGLLVPPGNGEALASSLLMLLDSPHLRRQLAEAGREKVRKRFDAATNTSWIVNRCEGLLRLP